MAGNVLGCWVFDICQNSLKLNFSSRTAKIFSWIVEMPYTQSTKTDLRHLPSSAFFVPVQTWNEPDHHKPLPQTLQTEQQQGQSCSGTRVATWCQPPSQHPDHVLVRSFPGMKWASECSWLDCFAHHLFQNGLWQQELRALSLHAWAALSS